MHTSSRVISSSFLLVVSLMVLFAHNVSARIAPEPAPSRTATASGEQTLMCEVPVQPTPDIRKAYDEHFRCIEPKVHAWLKKFPEDLARLESLYAAYQTGRTNDLRGSREAARYIKKHPVDFSRHTISLTDSQVQLLTPNTGHSPAIVTGNFQRIFVDKDNRRLFLTSDEIGLVSLSIAKRYAYSVEGSVGQSNGKEFFIYDNNTAFVEETTVAGNDRDLVVLDISDRNNPREVHRLRGILPAIHPGGAQYLTQIPNETPTFEQYKMIQEGRISLPGTCPTPLSGDIQCRLDRSCYRLETRDEADGLTCTPLQRIQMRRPTVTGRIHLDAVNMTTRRQSPVHLSEKHAASPTPTTRQSPPAVTPSADLPKGGAGGAGSLSQMMVIGDTLYVLSASHNLPQGWLTSFDIKKPRQPKVTQIIALDNGPEALQRHDNLLLIAGRNAVITASVAQPKTPKILGEYRQNCPVSFDPIVVEGPIAYRTIIVSQTRNTCSSRLEVIDLSQPHQPILRHTYNIERPRGLAVLSGALFIADETTGIQVFDLDDATRPHYITTWPLPGVKDLVISDFDLFALTPHSISNYYIAPMYEKYANLGLIASGIDGHVTVKNE